MTDTLVTAAQLAAACGSQTWVQQMSRQLPIVSFTDLRAAADAAFDILTDADWLEAFAHHPRIGDVAALRERFAASGALSEREQAGLADADDLVIEQLASGNDLYEQRFGFVYLIRAAGRSPR